MAVKLLVDWKKMQEEGDTKAFPKSHRANSIGIKGSCIYILPTQGLQETC